MISNIFAAENNCRFLMFLTSEKRRVHRYYGCIRYLDFMGEGKVFEKTY